MARVVRKISRKASRGQKRDNALLHSKKFWYIVAATVLVCAIVGVVVGVIVNNNKSEDTTVEVEDYFAQTWTYVDDSKVSHEIKFEKISYAGLAYHTNPNASDEVFYDYTFVFATDLSTFYPVDLFDNDDKNLKNKEHEQIFNALIKLQYFVNLYNDQNEDYDIKLLIVDASSKTGSSNTQVLLNPKFGGSQGEDVTMMLSLVDHDGYVSSYNKTDEDGKTTEVSLVCTGASYNTYSTAITRAINYMKNGFKDIVAE